MFFSYHILQESVDLDQLSALNWSFAPERSPTAKFKSVDLLVHVAKKAQCFENDNIFKV
jgi:hypothetical protein